MASAAVVLTNLGSDHWDAEVYAVLSMASRLAALVKSRARTIQLGYQLWRLNTVLSNFFKEIREGMDARNVDKPSPGFLPTPEQIEDGIRSLRQIHIKIETIYEAARRARLTNNSLLAMPLRSVHTYSDDILELAELLEAYQNSEGVEDIFDRSAKERARGEIYDLTEIE
jgi:hypothetical protein